ncbi:AraC family transcriptional regulator [Sinomicrobium weinanense]|uniref:AraC family transcriptional regulator n=1 Tax=Sinomicrobium weinanense TaxID=2842200 RepID=A0A926JW19_9FLAO|nr:helix-turn-helix domain-containing protein [Sinomicrobium weinanense]MBC9798228.1 AraC family transcriptional regulator [Sinomicrobium weinanense]MBU3125320.1 helix-turn-helix domain-containing protein [Sinomicrobium weinanense]
MSIEEIVLASFSVQAVLLGIFLLIKRSGNVYANRIFAFFLLLFAFGIYCIFTYWGDVNKNTYLAVIYAFYIPFSLYGCTYYFYIRNMATGIRITIGDFYHFIPFLAVLVLFGGYIFSPMEAKIYAYEHKALEQYEMMIPAIDYVLTAFLIAYAVVSYIKFVRFYSGNANLKLWLRVLSLAFIMFSATFVVYITLVFLDALTRNLDYLICYFMVFFIGVASYFSILYPGVFSGKPIARPFPFGKYVTSGLSANFSKELKEKLELLMRNEKPFLNPELKLDDLSEMLDISRHHTSQLINEQFNMSFYEFINKHRIEEAKVLLIEYCDQSVEQIAFESGFNNRGSFYKFFKRVEGITPSDYRNRSLMIS